MKHSYSAFALVLILAAFAFFSACKQNAFDVSMNCVPEEFTKRTWTIVVYMAADNDLEGAAIDDLNELESAAWPEGGSAQAAVTILALVDRIPGHDSSNGDWTGTRLYEISPDASGSNVVFTSEEIGCSLLGLAPGTNSELDTASPAVLESLIAFAKEYYEAEQYGLIVWGHGSGWKGSVIDSTAGTFMRTDELAKALEGKGLSFIGFDTCFGGILENAWSLKNCAKFLVGSEGIDPAGGWNYKELVQSWLNTPQSSASICSGIIRQYAAQYPSVSGATISVIDLAQLQSFRESFESFSALVASGITDETKRTALRSLTFGSCKLFHDDTYPSDSFIDIGSLASVVRTYLDSICGDASTKAAIKSAADELESRLHAAVPECWSGGDGNDYAANAKKIGVHLIPFIAHATPKPSHDSEYIKGSGSASTNDFVRTSTGWVPNAKPENSFLDVLFYRTY